MACTDFQGHPRSMMFTHLKGLMQFPIGDQQQPRSYLSPFSHNTSVIHNGHIVPIASHGIDNCTNVYSAVIMAQTLQEFTQFI